MLANKTRPQSNPETDHHRLHGPVCNNAALALAELCQPKIRDTTTTKLIKKIGHNGDQFNERVQKLLEKGLDRLKRPLPVGQLKEIDGHGTVAKSDGDLIALVSGEHWRRLAIFCKVDHREWQALIDARRTGDGRFPAADPFTDVSFRNGDRWEGVGKKAEWTSDQQLFFAEATRRFEERLARVGPSEAQRSIDLAGMTWIDYGSKSSRRTQQA